MKKIKIFFLHFLMLYSLSTQVSDAALREAVVFSPSVPVNVNQLGPYTIDDTASVIADLNIRVNNNVQIYDWSRCTGVGGLETINGYTKWYLAVGNIPSQQGLSFLPTRILNSAGAVGGFWWDMGAVPAVWQSQASRCHVPGDTYNFVPPSVRLQIGLTINRNTATPGRYVVSLPFGYAYEENKGYPDGAPKGFDLTNLLDRIFNTRIGSVPVIIDVVSRCNFQTSDIQLNHGQMTPASSEGNITRPYNLNVSCSSGTSVSVSIVGANPVSGRTENFTRCGNGGSCEITFNGGRYRETMQISGSTNLAITSTYHPNQGTPIEGAFSGSAVLSILVN
ncbi:Fimbrial protein [Edwardsiella anguillarum]|uniref:hypothetical protein n=1 Tax=Edwardsiella TaxID=635 RepID=UPI000A8FE0D6|nr:hypothetical protein [Edwardsiella anguillarum]BET81262.1 Fimbrial protein [Edwardsiella anguillarum]BET84689.1 Fimbrial protein [Edwardsiella anguillarum]BET88054.1 Fimbrial protein [Edwardsiella anguillarum]BET91345.1 Fimbrial protein [Edwardsiella anguillarum]